MKTEITDQNVGTRKEDGGMDKNEDEYLLIETTRKAEHIIGIPRAYMEVGDLDAAWEALNKISVFISLGLTERHRLQRRGM